VDVILLCVRWYVAYSLSLRNLEEMMVEHGIEVDHSTGFVQQGRPPVGCGRN
jgi:putative transposase